ncbi:MAG: hypothetical protein AAF621_00240 [Pseudomonadota bacterium]
MANIGPTTHPRKKRKLLQQERPIPLRRSLRIAAQKKVDFTELPKGLPEKIVDFCDLNDAKNAAQVCKVLKNISEPRKKVLEISLKYSASDIGKNVTIETSLNDLRFVCGYQPDSHKEIITKICKALIEALRNRPEEKISSKDMDYIVDNWKEIYNYAAKDEPDYKAKKLLRLKFLRGLCNRQEFRVNHLHTIYEVFHNLYRFRNGNPKEEVLKAHSNAACDTARSLQPQKLFEMHSNALNKEGIEGLKEQQFIILMLNQHDKMYSYHKQAGNELDSQLTDQELQDIRDSFLPHENNEDLLFTLQQRTQFQEILNDAAERGLFKKRGDSYIPVKIIS